MKVRNLQIKIKRRWPGWGLRVFLTLIMGGVFVACNGGKNRTNIELIQDMMDQESIKAQDWDPETPHQLMMRTPPENTVARNRPPYPYHLNYQAAEKNLKNPFEENAPAVLSRGKKYFSIYCAVCHGERAEGESPVADKMTVVRPPSLLTQQVIRYSDARIFHIITDGQGLMSGYTSQMHRENDRWAIVNYLRTLQRAKIESDTPREGE